MKHIRYMLEMTYPAEGGETRSELHARTLLCRDEAEFEAKLTIAQAEAAGEITVEEVADEPAAPSQLDKLEAQLTYTAMMTDTLLEV